MTSTRRLARCSPFHQTATLRTAVPKCVILVCGPHISDSIAISHMTAIMHTGRRLAFVLLREPSREIMWFIQRVQFWRGASVAWEIVDHTDWARVSQPCSLAVLSSGGFYLDDERIGPLADMQGVSPDDLAKMYASRTNPGAVAL